MDAAPDGEHAALRNAEAINGARDAWNVERFRTERAGDVLVSRRGRVVLHREPGELAALGFEVERRGRSVSLRRVEGRVARATRRVVFADRRDRRATSAEHG